MNKSYDIITFILIFFLRWPRIANFADISQIATMLIKTTFKYSIKVKRIRKNVLKCNLPVFLDMRKVADFR